MRRAVSEWWLTMSSFYLYVRAGIGRLLCCCGVEVRSRQVGSYRTWCDRMLPLRVAEVWSSLGRHSDISVEGHKSACPEVAFSLHPTRQGGRTMGEASMLRTHTAVWPQAMNMPNEKTRRSVGVRLDHMSLVPEFDVKAGGQCLPNMLRIAS